jgi:hypothetical protein
LNVISSRRGGPFCSPSTIDVGGDALAEHIIAIETHSQYHGYVIC